jgi:predicted ATPase
MVKYSGLEFTYIEYQLKQFWGCFKMSHDVFVSYAEENKTAADTICTNLEENGIPCWMAPRDILPGRPYSEGIIDGINECSVMVLVFSSNSNESPFVLSEIERAVTKGLNIIPFRLENIPLSKALQFYLSVPHWLNAFDGPIEKHLSLLIDSVKQLLDKTPEAHEASEASILDLSRTPFPLAAALDEYYHTGAAKDPAHKSRLLQKVVAILIQYTSFICLCDYMKRIKADLNCNERIELNQDVHNLIRKCTLDNLIDFSQKLLKMASKEVLFIPPLRDFYLCENPSLTSIFERFQSNNIPKRDIEEVVSAADFLADYPLDYVKSSRELGHDEHELDVSSYMGNEPSRHAVEKSIIAKNDCKTHELVIYNPYLKETLSLEPFLRFFPVCPCGKCSLTNRMGMFESFTSNIRYCIADDLDHVVHQQDYLQLGIPFIQISRSISPQVLTKGESVNVILEAKNTGDRKAVDINWLGGTQPGLVAEDEVLRFSGTLEPNETATASAQATVDEVEEVVLTEVRFSYSDGEASYLSVLPERRISVKERTPPKLVVSTQLSSGSALKETDLVELSLEITNKGSTTARNIGIEITIPENMELGSDDYQPEERISIPGGSTQIVTYKVKAIAEGDYCIQVGPITFSDADGNDYRIDAIPLSGVIEFSWNSDCFGREAELNILRKTLDQALSGSGRVLFISGNAGVGKSRLLAEAIKASKAKGFRFLTAECEAVTSDLPFLPLKLLFQRGFGLENGLSSEEKAEQTMAEILRIAPGLENNIPTINSFLFGMQDDLLGGDASTERERFFLSISELLSHFSASQPILMCIDDLQWADSGTLDIVHFLARRLSKMAVVIICTYRTEELIVTDKEVHPLKRTMRQMASEHLFDEIKLAGLNEENIGAIVKSIFPRSAFSSGFTGLLFKETEGNALFVVEILRSLHQQGVIARENGVWVLKQELERLEIPETLDMAIHGRLEKLGDEELAELQNASVIGREFYYQILKELSEHGEDALLEALENSIKLSIVVELPAEEERLSFVHGKIQEVIYKEIMGIKRKRLHGRVAELIEQLFKDRLTEFIPVLATHYYRAGEKEKAFGFLIEAGEQSARRFSTTEAKIHLERALEIVDNLEASDETSQKKRAVLRDIASLHKQTGNYEQAEVLYRQCMAIDEEREDEYERGWSFDNLGDIYRLKGDYEKAEDLYNKALEISQKKSEYDDLQYEALVDLGALYLLNSQKAQRAGKRAKAQIEAQKSIDHIHKVLQLIGDDTGQDRIRIRCHQYLSNVYLITNDFVRAIQYAQSCTELAERHNATKVGHLSLGNAYCQLGDYANARSSFDKLRIWSRNAGFKRFEVAANKLLGAACALQGEYEKSINYLSEALVANEGDIYKEIIPGIHVFLGESYRQLGESDKAREAFIEVAKAQGIQSDDLNDADVLRIVGLEFFGRGYYGKAIDYIGEYLATSERSDESRQLNAVLAESYINYGKVQEHLANYEKAKELYSRAVTIAREENDAEREWWALDYMGDIYLKSGAFEMAEETYNECLEKAREEGKDDLIQEINMDLAELFATSSDITVEESCSSVQSYDSELAYQAESHTKTALAMAKERGDFHCQYRAYKNFSYIAYNAGKLTTAIQYSILASKIAKEQFLELSVLTFLAKIYRRLSNFDKAVGLGRQYVDWATTIMEKKQLVQACADLGVTFLLKGDYSEASEFLQKAYDLNESINDTTIVPELLSALGQIAEHNGKREEALSCYQRAVNKGCADISDEELSSLMIQLGILMYSREEFPRARFFFENALSNNSLNPEESKRVNVYLQDTLFKLGEDMKQAGNYESALEFLERSLLLVGESDEEHALDRIVVSKADIYRYKGDYDMAKMNYERVLTQVPEGSEIWLAAMRGLVDTIWYQAKSRIRDCDINNARELLDEAKRKAQAALHIASEKNDHQAEMELLISLGNISWHEKDLEKALELFEKAINIADENFLGGEPYRNLGTVYRVMGNLDKALAAYKEYLEYATDVQDKRMELLGYISLGMAFCETGDFEKAYNYFDKSLFLNDILNITEYRVASLISKGEACLKEGEEVLGLKHLEDSATLRGRKDSSLTQPEILEETALELAASGEFSKAIWFLEYISEKFPDHCSEKGLDRIKNLCVA